MPWSTRRKKQQTETDADPTRLGRCFVGVVVSSAWLQLFECCSFDDRSDEGERQGTKAESRNKPTQEVNPRPATRARATARKQVQVNATMR